MPLKFAAAKLTACKCCGLPVLELPGPGSSGHVLAGHQDIGLTAGSWTMELF